MVRFDEDEYPFKGWMPYGQVQYKHHSKFKHEHKLRGPTYSFEKREREKESSLRHLITFTSKLQLQTLK